jgi:predicted Zn-dependent peptidase
MGWLTPPFLTQGDAEADVFASILGSGESSRLYRRLVYELEIAQDVSSHQESLGLASVFTATVTGRPGVSVATLLHETEAVLADLVGKTPASDREILRARNRITTSSLTSLQRLGGFGGKADRLNSYNHHLGKPDALAADLARYDRVTPASLQQFATSFFGPMQRVLVTTLPAEVTP